ncbi:tyrosine-type recombinase/integrase [Hymenobacter siberiensis]|uniref:tyrosine-type recombinase/integrase n=1 Tax=Hymenobacter siberiensis TaxID=2848396 RepID=UPI001C1E579D|nr:tyrosine-type recombinase/integrase [Hymenobacter siberiensis]
MARTERTIYLRYLTTSGSATFYPGAETTLPKWDGKAQRLRGTSLEVKKANNDLVAFRKDVDDAIEALRKASPYAGDPLPAQVKARLANGGQSAAQLSLGEQTLPELMRSVCLMREGELRKSTRTQYGYGANCLERFCPAADPRWKLAQLSSSHLESFRQWLVRPKATGGLGVDNQTANNRLSLVAATLSYFRDLDRAYRQLLDEELVLTCARKFKVVKHVRTHLNEDELLIFYQATLPPESRGSELLVRDIYCLSWLTSLRQSDLFSLGPHHVEWKDGVPVALNTTSIKSLKVTRLPLNELAARIVLWWLDRDRPELATGTRLQRELARFPWPADHLFPLVSRRRHGLIKLLWERLGLFGELVEVVKSKGSQQLRTLVPRRELLTLHTARHGFGNFMAANNVPIEDTKLFMGHSETKTTEIYYHRPEEQAFERAQHALDAMSARQSRKD